MDRKQLNTSPGIVDIGPISQSETKNIYFDKETDWDGIYTLSIWDDDRKTNRIILDDYLIILGTRITWEINPIVQEISVGVSYFELQQVDGSIQAKGNLNIVL